jgi:hypothetical protein
MKKIGHALYGAAQKATFYKTIKVDIPSVFL